MQFTAKTRYAILGLVALAKKPRHESDTQTIAKETNIPAPYLAKIMQELKKKGLVYSVRGKKGGFGLKEKPKKISLKKIFEKVEPIALSRCLPYGCKSIKNCPIIPVWLKIQKQIYNSLEKTTLADLV